MLSQCPSCKKQIDVPDSAIGKKVRCTGCQAVFVVEPGAAASPKADPPVPKKKTTDAPKAPAPPPATLDVLDELPGEIDTLEEIADEPAVKKKGAAKKKPADDPNEPFSFEGPSPLAAEGPAPTLDFAPQVTTISAGTRYRARYSAGLMTTAAIVTLVLCIGLVGWGGLVLYQTKGEAPMLLSSACCTGSVSFVFVIIILVGARSLSKLRSRALGITAAIFSLLNALGGLACIVMAALEMVRSFERWQPFIAVVCVFQMALCLWAAISGGLVTMRAEVIAAIAETRKRV